MFPTTFIHTSYEFHFVVSYIKYLQYNHYHTAIISNSFCTFGQLLLCAL